MNKNLRLREREVGEEEVGEEELRNRAGWSLQTNVSPPEIPDDKDVN